jgi:hypothetical protein
MLCGPPVGGETGTKIPRGGAERMGHQDSDRRELHTVFSEMRAILDVFPSSAWAPDDAKAVLDVLSRRFFLHESQADVIELSGHLVENPKPPGDLLDDLEAG